MQRRIAYIAVLLLVVFAAIASCSDPLPPDYGLAASRILAVRANPPDLVPGGSVSLDALVFVPSPTDRVTYEWSWCAAVDSDLNCAESSTALAQQLDAAVSIDYALGTSATARFAYPVDPTILKALCTTTTVSDAGTDDAGDAGTTDDDAGDGGDAGDDAGTVDAGTKVTCNGNSLSVSVLLKVTVNGKEMRAAKTISIYPSQPAFTNTNPTIDGLELFDHAVTAPTDAGDRTDDGIADAAGDPSDAAIGVSRGDNGGLQLLLRVPTTASDSYTPGNGGGTGNGGGGGNGGGATTGNNAGGGIDVDAGDDDDGGDDDGGASSGPSDDGGNGSGGGKGDGGGGGDGGSRPADDGGGGSGDDAGPSGGGGVDDGGVGGGDQSTTTGATTTTDGGTANGAAGGNNEQHESLAATWYVQSGLLDSTSTTLAAGMGNATRDYATLVLNRWVPPGPGVYTVIVVLRDNRNGVGWIVQPIKVR